MTCNLIQGEAITEMQKIEENSIDCIITSPPYFKGYEYESYFNSYYQYLKFIKQYLEECKRVLSKDGTFYLNIANDVNSTIKVYEILNIATYECLFKLHDTIIWNVYNRQPVNSNRQLTNQTEFIFMLRHHSNNIHLNKNDVYNTNPDLFETKNVGNIWKLPFNKSRGKTQSSKKTIHDKNGTHGGFPLPLPESCLLLSTNSGDTVLDPFMGSGTTGVACIKHNRNFIGIELDEEIFNFAKKRCSEYQTKLEI